MSLWDSDIERDGSPITLPDSTETRAVVALPGQPATLRMGGGEDVNKADFFLKSTDGGNLRSQQMIEHRGQSYQIERVNPIEDEGLVQAWHVIADPDVKKSEWE